MRYLTVGLLTFFLAIQIGNCQDLPKSKFCIDGFYQGLTQTYFCIGIGRDKETEGALLTMDKKKTFPAWIHQSVYFGKFLTPDTLNKLDILHYDLLFNFKFFTFGIGARDLIMKNFNRCDISPQIGFGYRYFWIIYSRNIKLFDTKRLDLAKNNLTLRLYIPIFKY